MTRQQRYLQQAIDDIRSVLDQHDPELAKTYGGLCHSIPILVRNDGLAQAAAWIEEKASGADAENATVLSRAYALQARHMAALFGINGNEANSAKLVDIVRTASLTNYMRYTTILLDAWVFHKRFAISMLDSEGPLTDMEEEAA